MLNVMESTSEFCITCFSANENGFRIFSDRGNELEATAIINQYFWFEVKYTKRQLTMQIVTGE